MKYTLYTLTESHTITAQKIIAPEHDGYLLGSVHLEEQSRHGAQYARGIRAAVRGLWNGTFDIEQAFDAFDTTVNNGLTRAWYRGMAECSLKPADMTIEEKEELQKIINNEWWYIRPFLQDVEANSRANGGKWGPLKTRADKWGMRYPDVMNRARIMACSNQKYLWGFNALGHTKDPCNTCKVKLKDKVKRASYWFDKQVMPQNPPNSMLDCGGWG